MHQGPLPAKQQVTRPIEPAWLGLGNASLHGVSQASHRVALYAEPFLDSVRLFFC